MPTVELIKIGHMSAFIVRHNNQKYNTVTGSQWDNINGYWKFPAYPPFGDVVVRDLLKVDKTLLYTPDALEHAKYLVKVPGMIARREIPPLVYEGENKPPMDHQLEGLAHLYHNPRFALLYDAGLGKSKILIDLLRLFPDKRALILTPSITVQNWIDQIALHTNGTMKAASLTGSNARKRKILSGYKQYSAIVASYGKARTMGFPQFSKRVANHILDVKAADPSRSENACRVLARLIKFLPSEARQIDYVLAWAYGAKMVDIERSIVAELAGKLQWLDQIDYDIIIADESQRIQEGSSKQTQVALALAQKAERRYISSGSAILGDPRDIYTQSRFLSASIITESWLDFSRTHLVRSKFNVHQITGYKNMDILNSRIQRIAISKKKEECLTLPARTVIDTRFELSDEQVAAYNEVVHAQEEDVSVILNEGSGASTSVAVMNAAVRVDKLSQIASGFVYEDSRDARICDLCPHLEHCVSRGILPYTRNCKVVQKAPDRKVHYFKEQPRIELLEETAASIFAQPKEKVIIWAWYQAELDQIRAMFDRRGWTYHTVEAGDTNVQKKIKDFETTQNARAWIAQEATGIGITLNAASYMIYHSYGFALEPYLQSIDRNYRIGQTNKIFTYRFIGKQTVDEFKLSALDQKKDISDMLTKRIACVTCPMAAHCLAQDIAPFDPGCIYKRSSTRVVARPRRIEYESNP